MKAGSIVKTSFILSFISTMIGAWSQITHTGGTITFLIIAVISMLIFMGTAIYEIRTSIRIDHSEKNSWTIFLILFSGLAGIIYIFISRKRIVNL